MPHGDVLSHPDFQILRHVEDTTVLDVASSPQDDAVDVPSQYRMVPHAGLFSQLHPPYKGRSGGDEGRRGNLREGSLEGIKREVLASQGHGIPPLSKKEGAPCCRSAPRFEFAVSGTGRFP